MDKKRNIIYKFEIDIARIECDNIPLLGSSSQGLY